MNGSRKDFLKLVKLWAAVLYELPTQITSPLCVHFRTIGRSATFASDSHYQEAAVSAGRGEAIAEAALSMEKVATGLLAQVLGVVNLRVLPTTYVVVSL